MGFRTALVISGIIHATIFAPFYNQQMLKEELEKKRSVVVDYVVLKEIAQAITTNKIVVLKTPETPRIDIKKEVTPTPQPAGNKREELKKQTEETRLKELARSLHETNVKAAAKEAAKKTAEAKKNKDYVSYYQLIREKMRSRLKENYRYYTREGDVHLSFTITPKGYLLSYNIDTAKSTDDEVLKHMTAMSLKAVTPFPSVPKSLSSDKVTFSIIISFKK